MRANRVRAARPRRTAVRRQAFGNFASAMQQRDATNVVINAQEEFKLCVPTGCTEATGVRNMNAILTTSPMFFNYATMYDQFKMNAVRISVEMTYINNQLLNSATFPSICTAWDRNGIRPRTVKIGPDPAPNPDNRPVGYLLPIYGTVSSYSSANERTLYYGAKWSVVRQLDASSMMEKSIYVGTVNTKDILTTDNLYGAWNPQFLLSIKSPTPTNANATCIFQIHYQFDVTMRGLRKIAYSTINELREQLMPNDRFMGYTPSNFGYVCANQAGVYVTVTDNAPANNQIVNAYTFPTINPNMVTIGGGDVNGGIYMPPAGTADSNLKL